MVSGTPPSGKGGRAHLRWSPRAGGSAQARRAARLIVLQWRRHHRRALRLRPWWCQEDRGGRYRWCSDGGTKLPGWCGQGWGGQPRFRHLPGWCGQRRGGQPRFQHLPGRVAHVAGGIGRRHHGCVQSGAVHTPEVRSRDGGARERRRGHRCGQGQQAIKLNSQGGVLRAELLVLRDGLGASVGEHVGAGAAHRGVGLHHDQVAEVLPKHVPSLVHAVEEDHHVSVVELLDGALPTGQDLHAVLADVQAVDDLDAIADADVLEAIALAHRRLRVLGLRSSLGNWQRLLLLLQGRKFLERLGHLLDFGVLLAVLLFLLGLEPGCELLLALLALQLLPRRGLFLLDQLLGGFGLLPPRQKSDNLLLLDQLLGGVRLLAGNLIRDTPALSILGLGLRAQLRLLLLLKLLPPELLFEHLILLGLAFPFGLLGGLLGLAELLFDLLLELLLLLRILGRLPLALLLLLDELAVHHLGGLLLLRDSFLHGCLDLLLCQLHERSGINFLDLRCGHLQRTAGHGLDSRHVGTDVLDQSGTDILHAGGQIRQVHRCGRYDLGLDDDGAGLQVQDDVLRKHALSSLCRECLLGLPDEGVPHFLIGFQGVEVHVLEGHLDGQALRGQVHGRFVGGAHHQLFRFVVAVVDLGLFRLGLEWARNTGPCDLRRPEVP
mmetsp:Transcript_35531/g.94631  ORF Transcript_35531/g.94631 Transcript_35531/m.94631 type:complete len:662 (+) Transcript_35531:263-2248(+)